MTKKQSQAMPNKEYMVIFDVETTGLSKQYDWIIQLSAIKVDKNTFRIVDTFDTYICPNKGNFEINPAAESIHGISKDFLLVNGKDLNKIGPEFLEFLGTSDLCGFNSNAFDVEFLYKDFTSIGLQFPDLSKINSYDVYKMHTHLQPNNLGSLYKRYIGKTMEEDGLDAHNALSDVKATLAVMEAQFKKFNLEWTEISDWQENKMLVPDGTVRLANRADQMEMMVFSHGKYKDRDVYDVMLEDAGYMKWAAKNLFSGYTLGVVRDYCTRKQKGLIKAPAVKMNIDEDDVIFEA